MATVDQSRVKSGFDVEALVTGRYLQMLLQTAYDAGVMPSSAVLDGTRVQLAMLPDASRLYELTPAPDGSFPPTAVHAFQTEILFDHPLAANLRVRAIVQRGNQIPVPFDLFIATGSPRNARTERCRRWRWRSTSSTSIQWRSPSSQARRTTCRRKRCSRGSSSSSIARSTSAARASSRRSRTSSSSGTRATRTILPRARHLHQRAPAERRRGGPIPAAAREPRRRAQLPPRRRGHGDGLPAGALQGHVEGRVLADRDQEPRGRIRARAPLQHLEPEEPAHRRRRLHQRRPDEPARRASERAADHARGRVRRPDRGNEHRRHLHDRPSAVDRRRRAPCLGHRLRCGRRRAARIHHFLGGGARGHHVRPGRRPDLPRLGVGARGRRRHLLRRVLRGARQQEGGRDAGRCDPRPPDCQDAAVGSVLRDAPPGRHQAEPGGVQRQGLPDVRQGVRRPRARAAGRHGDPRREARRERSDHRAPVPDTRLRDGSAGFGAPRPGNQPARLQPGGPGRPRPVRPDARPDPGAGRRSRGPAHRHEDRVLPRRRAHPRAPDRPAPVHLGHGAERDPRRPPRPGGGARVRRDRGVRGRHDSRRGDGRALRGRGDADPGGDRRRGREADPGEAEGDHGRVRIADAARHGVRGDSRAPPALRPRAGRARDAAGEGVGRGRQRTRRHRAEADRHPPSRYRRSRERTGGRQGQPPEPSPLPPDAGRAGLPVAAAPSAESFVAALADAEIGATFNFYRDGARAPLLRARLAAYLAARDASPFLLVAEAPGYRGTRVSGVPLTSERQLTGSGAAEATATIVHGVLDELGAERDVVLWNLVPTHPHRPGRPETNRPPTTAEISSARTFVEALTAGRTVIAVGRLAAAELGLPYVRHPSHGGAAAFRTGLARLLG